MQTIHCQKRLIDWKSFRLRAAKKEDCTQFVTEPAIIKIDGIIAGAYIDISEMDTVPVRGMLSRAVMSPTMRSSGMYSNSTTFGYMPRRPLGRGDFCGASRISRDTPDDADIIEDFLNPLTEVYRNLNPSLYKLHTNLADKILPEWRIHGLYSSGIINKDNPLPYHFDTGNIDNCWSIMPVFKHNIEGGHLSIPQLDMCIELKDHTCLMFDGQQYMHGVTAFEKTAPDGYRYSVVYYTMQQLWACLPFDEELQRVREQRTLTEERTAKGELHPELQKKLDKRKKERERNANRDTQLQ